MEDPLLGRSVASALGGINHGDKPQWTIAQRLDDDSFVISCTDAGTPCFGIVTRHHPSIFDLQRGGTLETYLARLTSPEQPGSDWQRHSHTILWTLVVICILGMLATMLLFILTYETGGES